jgi:hypothetical protein
MPALFSTFVLSSVFFLFLFLFSLDQVYFGASNTKLAVQNVLNTVSRIDLPLPSSRLFPNVSPSILPVCVSRHL